MQVIERVDELSAALADERALGHTVGLVPTMGALHDGHASLIERAGGECEHVVVSLFVNPLQFGPSEDFASYPRDLEADIAVAKKAGADVVFAPAREEMLPGDARTTVHVDGLGDVLEGTARPGHFEGVATVVTKLLALAGRCRAYFGEKDFQQLVVVRRLVADLSLPATVVGCATVRDFDGVALSSRNRYLSVEGRAAAPVLYRALRAGAASIVAGEQDVVAVTDLMGAIVEAEPLVELGYAAVVEPVTLAPPSVLDGELRLLVAARVDGTRLIDNVPAVAG
ncbi:MAG: pantoate--beta-alanine ligase [Actinomycetota bacterium]|nr:pantoate--beta-alanine ligase [Actinomycetota bacterium]